MRIVYLVGTLARGGVESLVVNLCRLLIGTHQLKVVCLLGKSGPLVEVAERMGVEVVGLDPPSLRDPRGVADLVGHLRTFRPDVIHSQIESSLPQQLAAARLGGCRHLVVTCHHVFGGLNRAQRVRAFLQGRLARYGGVQLVAVSRSVRASFSEAFHVPQCQIRVVYNGIDLEKYEPKESRFEAREKLGWPHDEEIVLSVANLRYQKDHMTLLGAFALVAEVNPRARLYLVGDGPLRPMLEERVRALGLGDVVRFLGSSGGIPRLLWAADAFAIASLYEGFGLVLVEAAAADKPIVATRIPAFEEVTNGNDAVELVPPRDESSFARAVLSTLRRVRPGDRATSGIPRAVVERFSLERCAGEYFSVYRGRPMLSKRRHR